MGVNKFECISISHPFAARAAIFAPEKSGIFRTVPQSLSPTAPRVLLISANWMSRSPVPVFYRFPGVLFFPSISPKLIVIYVDLRLLFLDEHRALCSCVRMFGDEKSRRGHVTCRRDRGRELGPSWASRGWGRRGRERARETDLVLERSFRHNSGEWRKKRRSYWSAFTLRTRSGGRNVQRVGAALSNVLRGRRAWMGRPRGRICPARTFFSGIFSVYLFVIGHV